MFLAFFRSQYRSATCIYPRIIFTSAFATILESIPFISSKAGNTIGLTTLFVLFLINYSAYEYKNLFHQAKHCILITKLICV